MRCRLPGVENIAQASPPTNVMSQRTMPVQTVIRICLTAFMSHAPLMGLYAEYRVKLHRHQISGQVRLRESARVERAATAKRSRPTRWEGMHYDNQPYRSAYGSLRTNHACDRLSRESRRPGTISIVEAHHNTSHRLLNSNYKMHQSSYRNIH